MAADRPRPYAASPDGGRPRPRPFPSAPAAAASAQPHLVARSTPVPAPTQDRYAAAAARDAAERDTAARLASATAAAAVPLDSTKQRAPKQRAPEQRAPKQRVRGRGVLQGAFFALLALGTLLVGITVVPELLSTTDAKPYAVRGDYVVVSADFPHNHLSVPNRAGLAPIDRETVDPQGYLGIPEDVHRVGVYTGAGKLDGAVGDVVIAGHVNYVGQGAGYLGDLSKLKAGQVIITRGAGAPKAWRVTKVSMYLKSLGLPQSIFRARGARQLTLVTCGGVLDANEGSYLSNVVVTARPVRTVLRDPQG